MAKRYPGAFLCVLMLSMSSLSGCAEKAKRTLEILHGSAAIVAYGSLISLPSLEQTLGHPYSGPIHEVHLEGLREDVGMRSPVQRPQAIAEGAPKIDVHFLRNGERIPIIGAAELNIYPKKKGPDQRHPVSHHR